MTDDVRLLAATAAHLDAIVDLALDLGRLHVGFDGERFSFDAFGATNDDVRRTYVDFFSAQLPRPDVVLLIAVSGDHETVGYVLGRLEEKSFLDLSDAAGWIHDLYVKPHARGREIASRLLDRAVAGLRDAGARQVRLSVAPGNRPARRMFEGLGFVPTMIEHRLDDRRRHARSASPGTTRTPPLESDTKAVEACLLRPAAPGDSAALIALSVATGLFEVEEADSLLGGILRELHAGRLDEGHLVRIAVDETDTPLGWVYASADVNAAGVWELWWIGVAPSQQQRGVGATLLELVEAHVRDASGRLLLIATSSSPALARTRGFYERRGYRECGCIPDFYAEGEDKVMFSKRLSPRPPARAASAP